MTHRIGNSEVKVIHGDICDSKCEVIVSSDDSRLSQGGGVSFAIARAGGRDIRRQAERLTPGDLGDVAVTTAGELPQKYIFHAVTIDFENYRTISAELQDFIVKNSVRRCFQLMAALNLSSIAFPVIGTGVAGIPVERAGRRMAETFVEELGRMNRGLSVELWIFMELPSFAYSFSRELAKYDGLRAGLISSTLVDVAASKAFATGKTDAEGKHSECPDDGSVREVFISYSRQDGNAADWICKVLGAAGISYWRDVDGIYSGQNYKGVIARAIRAAHTVFFLSSKSSNASDNVVGEIGAALHFRKHIVPIRLDASEYNDNILMDLLYLDHIDVESLGQEKASEKFCKVALLNRANSGLRP